MKQPKLVVLRGKPTSGKSTAFCNLKKINALKNWELIDFPAIKTKVKNKDSAKKCLFNLLKEVMKSQKNILLEEMSEKTLRKYINYYIKKYNYQIITFQFEVSLKTAYKRDVQRAKEKWHDFMGKKWIDETHKMHEERFDNRAILVNCDKLSKKQVVRFILKELKLK